MDLIITCLEHCISLYSKQFFPKCWTNIVLFRGSCLEIVFRCRSLNNGQPFFDGHVRYDASKLEEILTFTEKSTGLVHRRSRIDSALLLMQHRLPFFPLAILKHDFVTYWNRSGGPARLERCRRRNIKRRKGVENEDRALEQEELVTPTKTQQNVQIYNTEKQIDVWQIWLSN